MKKKVFCLDNYPIEREGLRAVIDRQEDLMVCGESAGIREALNGIRKSGPDLLITEIGLQGALVGLDVVRMLKAEFPNLPILVFSIYDEILYAERVLRVGAKGYLMKREPVETLLQALRKLLSGEVCVSERMSKRFINRFSQGPQDDESRVGLLSDRELEIFRLIGNGCKTRQIAEMLHLSIKTIETHRAHIKEKLHLSSGNELVYQAVHWIQSGELTKGASDSETRKAPFVPAS